jgi:hypothetical protein
MMAPTRLGFVRIPARPICGTFDRLGFVRILIHLGLAFELEFASGSFGFRRASGSFALGCFDDQRYAAGSKISMLRVDTLQRILAERALAPTRVGTRAVDGSPRPRGPIGDMAGCFAG